MPIINIPLSDRQEVADDTMAFWFDLKGQELHYLAGQSGDFTIPQLPNPDTKGATRTFSLAQAENGKTVMVATRMRSSAFKNYWRDMPLGSVVQLSGPMGNMVLHEDVKRPAVFLAGGIGITPFRAMVEAATLKQLPHRITLFYSNRTRGSIAFYDDFVNWATQNKNFRFVPTLTDDVPPDWPFARGLIGPEMLQRYLPDLAAPIYYIAGPPAMVTGVQGTLTALGISRDNIRSEDFSGY